MYDYKAEIVKVVDGDTVDVIVDLGFRITTHQRLRLKNIDTPELRSSNALEREHAKRAKWFVEGLIDHYGWKCLIRTEKTGKYGRWIAEVEFSDGVMLSEALEENGFAKRESYGE